MNKLQVSIVMGSDSDLLIMKEAAEILEEFKIGYEILILSAHRTPEETIAFSKKSEIRGIKVIIAGASGSAHLAGIIAANCCLPVIGIPIQSPALNGIDSLYSTVGMPSGVPVATVGINGAKNAGILALEILAIFDHKIKNLLKQYKKTMSQKVLEKSDKLQKIGYKKYLELQK